MKPLVSVACITYNHEPFIADAIESFLMQKTNFDYEILIGEDKSTDRTLQIVEEYRKKYSDKIRIITSSINVGGDANCERVYASAKGKYIALCEGDDFWTDPYKLQKQVDYMEQHPDCTLCFHNGKVIDWNKEPLGKLHVPWSAQQAKYYYGENHKYDAGEMALLDFVPTASLLFRTEHILPLPDFFYGSIAGDIVIRLIMTSKGYAYYIDDVMCVYRLNVKGSASEEVNKVRETKEGRILCMKKYIYLIDEFNKYSNYQYEEDLAKAKMLHWEVPLLLEEGRIQELKKPEYREYFNGLNFCERVKPYFKYYTPYFYKKLKEINESRIKYLGKNKS